MEIKKKKCTLCQRIWILKDKDKLEEFEARGKCPICYYGENIKEIKRKDSLSYEQNKNRLV